MKIQTTIIEIDPSVIKRKASKDYFCVLCDDTIKIGEEYLFKKGVLNCDKGNSFYRIYKAHLACHDYYLKQRQKLGDESIKEIMNRTKNIFKI